MLCWDPAGDPRSLHACRPACEVSARVLNDWQRYRGVAGASDTADPAAPPGRRDTPSHREEAEEAADEVKKWSSPGEPGIH